jgi:hypothetical protein
MSLCSKPLIEHLSVLSFFSPASSRSASTGLAAFTSFQISVIDKKIKNLTADER